MEMPEQSGSSLRSIQTETTGRGRKEGSSSLPPPPCPVTGRHCSCSSVSAITCPDRRFGSSGNKFRVET
ncbi:hypothetical protein INR49_022247 [Caranx melampygus]|nr:hypothetical protein INR49_022247 [Caranx melampygus]